MADIRKISVEVKYVKFTENQSLKNKALGFGVTGIVLLEELLIAFFNGFNSLNTSFVMMISSVLLITVFIYEAPNGDSLARHFLKILLNHSETYLYSDDDSIYDDLSEYEQTKTQAKISSNDFIIEGEKDEI